MKDSKVDGWGKNIVLVTITAVFFLGRIIVYSTSKKQHWMDYFFQYASWLIVISTVITISLFLRKKVEAYLVEALNKEKAK